MGFMKHLASVGRSSGVGVSNKAIFGGVNPRTTKASGSTGFYSGRQVKVLTGDKQLAKTFRRMGGPAKVRMTRGAIARSLKVYENEIMAATNSSSAPPTVKAAARQLVASRFNRSGADLMKGFGGQDVHAVVGFGVGKAYSKKAERRSDYRVTSDRYRGGKQQGVGIAGMNIHWFVLGTNRRRHDSGKNVGSTDAYLEGVVPRAIVSGSPKALNAAKTYLMRAIKREAKRRSKNG